MSPPNVIETKWTRRTLALIACLFVGRLIYAAFVPIDLVHDEAYYWDWSRQLDWGYYSKPPMIAWLIALSTSMGSSAFTVRLPAVVLGTGGLLFVFLLARRMYDDRVGFVAVVLSAATPGNAAMSLIMTIDAPLMFCWSAALYFTWRFLEGGSTSNRWLLALSITIGLGLLSKQTMLGFVVLSGLFLLTSPEDRRQFLRPHVWLCVLASLAFLTPVLWWNSQHDWITFQHTSEHFSGQSVSLLKRFTRAGEFLLGQFGVASPVTLWLLAMTLFVAGRSLRRLERRERFLLSYCLLPLLLVVLFSFTRRVELNWPAPFYVSGFVLLAGTLAGGGFLQSAANLPGHAWRRAVIVGVASVLITYLLPFGFGLQGSKLDPVVRLRGWQDLGAEVGQKLAALPDAEKRVLVVTAGRGLASELAFYLPDQPTVLVWHDKGQVISQYDVWGLPAERRRKHAVVITPGDREVPDGLRAEFDAVKPIESVVIPVGQQREHHYRLWLGTNWSPAETTRIARLPE